MRALHILETQKCCRIPIGDYLPDKEATVKKNISLIQDLSCSNLQLGPNDSYSGAERNIYTGTGTRIENLLTMCNIMICCYS